MKKIKFAILIILLIYFVIILNGCRGVQEPIEFQIGVGVSSSLTIITKITIIQGTETIYSANIYVNTWGYTKSYLTLGRIPAYPTMKVVVENPSGYRAEWTNINYNPVDIFSANIDIIIGSGSGDSYLENKTTHYPPSFFNF